MGIFSRWAIARGMRLGRDYVSVTKENAREEKGGGVHSYLRRKEEGIGKKPGNGRQKGSFRKGCYIYDECPQGMVSRWMG